MAEAEPKKLESQPPSDPPPAPAPAPEAVDAPKEVSDEKSAIPAPPLPLPQDNPDESESLAVIEKSEEVPESGEEKNLKGSTNRDAVLTRVATEKKLSLVRAWEESEKSFAENKAYKKLSAIEAWEKTKKATVEAELKQMEEKLEKQKAEYVEKMKNKEAFIHKAAEEKRAIIEAKRGEDLLKAEEKAAKYRATGTAPKKLLGIFSS